VTLQDAFAHAEILFGPNVLVTQTIVRQGDVITIECAVGYRRPEGVHIWKGRTFEDAIKTARGMPVSTL
jgi:hypothetical protein